MKEGQNEITNKLIITQLELHIEREDFIKTVIVLEEQRKVYFGYPKHVDGHYLFLNIRGGFAKLPIANIRQIVKAINKHEDDWC